MNERITENIVRDTLRNLGYFDNEDIIIEEQKSQNTKIQSLLRSASKTGKGGVGAPEFIIKSKKIQDFVIIFECKADNKRHASEFLDCPRDFAADGAIHYASYLAKEFNVIAIGCSGQSKGSLRISTYLQPRSVAGVIPDCKPLNNKSGTQIDKIIGFENLIEHATYDPEVEKGRLSDLMSFSKDLHNYMRDYAKLSESEKPLLVSGVLIALSNFVFSKVFSVYTPDELPEKLCDAIEEEIKKSDIPHAKKQNMIQPYSFLRVHPELSRADKLTGESPLYNLIDKINIHAWPFISVYHDYDIIGQFYGEFLRYTGGDKKALGIVLTPRHITDLFSRIANVQKDSTVFDPCCGTGGFLVSAMHQMFKKCITDEEKARVKQYGLIGVEQQPNMYALAASNMILRGDGKANLHQGSCFDDAITKEIISRQPDIGMINPPYAQKGKGLHELAFVEHMLDCLKVGGTGIAIVPMSCVITPHETKHTLLSKHCLEAVMSMPDELFTPVGTITCIMVFTAHKPHEAENRKTWFGYWKDDGFEKTKQQGRTDISGRWEEIREKWLYSYKNREDIPGLCVKKQVTANDEWCAEAYMETDYSGVLKADFEEAVKKFLVFNILRDEEILEVDESGVEDDLEAPE
ncbi:SAM-dependent methyltransferase [Pseudomonas sp. SWRI79]|uniref:site-specific DNA-methyltransferase (adenine-specific) n=1 Tax=Pseudomonas farris TaxID=2841207 RepID=A0ABS6Q1L7_9PSED|nr:N-6 DNA methylase [Pseudomonas farris]MBV4466615.1 SAM-dependent methyltransferase [Pseudomonas farris]